MSIITKPSIVKGTTAQFTLNKVQLLANSVVAADSYFSDSQNWYRVNLVYKSTVGGQYEIVEFDATQSSPTGNFLISEKARDSFEILKIKIIDFDGGFLEIPRSSLTVANFDINVAVVNPPSSSNIVWDFAGNSNYSLNGQGELSSSYNEISPVTNTLVFSTTSYSIGNGLELVYKVDNNFFNDWYHFLGFSNEAKSLFSGFFIDGSGRAFGINNLLWTQYTYPATAEIEFKIVIKTTGTEFYANNVLLNTFGAVSANSTDKIIPTVRIKSPKVVKQFSITQL